MSSVGLIKIGCSGNITGGRDFPVFEGIGEKIAVSDYVIADTLKKRHKIETNLLHNSTGLERDHFRTNSLVQALTDSSYKSETYENNNQLFLCN